MEEGHVESWISRITLGVGDLALAPLLPGPPRLALLRPQHLTQSTLLCQSDDSVGERRVLDTEPGQVGHGDLVVVRTTSRLACRDGSQREDIFQTQAASSDRVVNLALRR